jgi:hypothetical protein
MESPRGLGLLLGLLLRLLLRLLLGLLLGLLLFIVLGFFWSVPGKGLVWWCVEVLVGVDVWMGLVEFRFDFGELEIRIQVFPLFQ